MNRIYALAAAAALAACTAQTPAADPVARGERYFQGLGCAKCHQIGGRGHAWGPDLTLVGFRKSSAWLEAWLRDPHAWNQKTLMPNFNLNEEARASLVAYLSAQKGQAWATRPWDEPAAAALSPRERGGLIFEKAGCSSCHAAMGSGGYPNNNVAGGLIPALALVADGYSRKELAEKIRHGSVPLPNDPKAAPAMLQMPKWGQVLKDGEIEALVEYLYALKPASAGKPDDF